MRSMLSAIHIVNGIWHTLQFRPSYVNNVLVVFNGAPPAEIHRRFSSKIHIRMLKTPTNGVPEDQLLDHTYILHIWTANSYQFNIGYTEYSCKPKCRSLLQQNTKFVD